ncbi:hypothetical protein [Agilicoccus flavus]|uniref:hypothetical protein n=1 Tax=Agilicoccus flavus TaxID=2775968 RepID=UPI001CF66FE3|nr:hypothetical protein [Agilicoccus flavus]
MSDSAASAAARLVAAAASGELERLCHREGVDLVVQFGSSVDSRAPGDVDVAVGLTPRADLIAVVNALADLVPGDHLDVMDLDRAGPVARHRALVGGRVLFAATPAAFFERELWAMREYMDTAPLRRALLEHLAR